MKEIVEEPVLAVVGPTAIGKTALSFEVASRFDCEIISLDSMQVYRGMDIGTAKATDEERAKVPHHLIDVCEPDEQYDAARFAADALRLVREIHGRGRLPFITGGSGLYLKALTEGLFNDAPVDLELREVLRRRLEEEGREKLHGELQQYDPETAQRVHVKDTQRLLRGLEIYLASGIPWSEHLRRQQERRREEGNDFRRLLLIGLTCDREKLYERINQRCKIMLQDGLEQEVRSLREQGCGPELKSMQSIGYRQMNEFLDGKYDYAEMERLLARDTRRYAKRQYTWFKQVEGLQWFDVAKDRQKILKTIALWLEM